MSTSFKNHMKGIWMVLPLVRMGRKIIQVRFDNILDIVEGNIHFPLEGSSSIFHIEGHFLVGEGPPRTNKGSFMLVFQINLNLVIPVKSIHKRKYLPTRTSINDLIDEGRRVVILGTRFI